MKCRHRVSDGQ